MTTSADLYRNPQVVSVVICACVSRGLCLHGCTGRNFEAVGAEGQHFVLLAASVCLIATLFFFLAHLTNLADWSRPRWAQMVSS